MGTEMQGDGRKGIVMLFHSFFMGFDERDDAELPDWALKLSQTTSETAATTAWNAGDYDLAKSKFLGPYFSVLEDATDLRKFLKHNLIVAKAVDKYHTDLTMVEHSTVEEVIAVSTIVWNPSRNIKVHVIRITDPLMETKTSKPELWESLEEADFSNLPLDLPLD